MRQAKHLPEEPGIKPVGQTDGHIVDDVEAWKQREVLEGAGDPESGQPLGGDARKGLTADQ